jgi:hypothetical protein
VEPNETSNQKIGVFDLVLIILALFSLFILLFLFFLDHQNPIYQLFRLMDALIALVFLGDFFYLLITSKNRSNYFFKGLGWLDFLGGLPFNGLGIFRLARLIRGLRLLRRTNARDILAMLRLRLAENTLFMMVFTATGAIFLAGAATLIFERGAAGANIDSAEEAI